MKLGIPGVVSKLDFEARQEAEALIPLVIDDPDAAAYEIIYLRELVKRWETTALALQALALQPLPAESCSDLGT